jgi:uncharacterized protein YndB with AHSA1/START domain
MSETMRLRARLSAPADTVRDALTDAGALRVWLAEHAEVKLPHRYVFWGRYTPEGDTPRQRLLHVDERSLRFTWALDGAETTVEIDLDEEAAGSTILTLSQTNLPDWTAGVPGSGTLRLMHTFWALSIANLADFVEGRPIVARIDFTSPRMRQELDINATPAAVFHSIVDAETFERWFGARLGIEPHVGGRWAMGGFELPAPPARILELEPGHRLAMSWPDGMVHTWELAGHGGGTRLTVVQSGFDERHPPYGAWAGWLGGLAELRRFHEVPRWRSRWLEVRVPGLPQEILTIDR